MRWRMDLIEARMERKLNVLEAIELAAESWNSIGGDIIRSCWLKTELIDAPAAADFQTENEYRRHSMAFQKDCVELATMLFKLKIDVDSEAYVDAEDAEEIHEPESTQEIVQYSADIESDEDEAPMVSTQEALKCCLLLRAYFVHCDGDDLSEHLLHLASMANAARKNGRSRARQVDITSFFR